MRKQYEYAIAFLYENGLIFLGAAVFWVAFIGFVRMVKG